MARLIIKSDSEDQNFELTPSEIASIGRDPSNAVPVPDARGASRRHCQITPIRRDGAPAYELRDLGATNKTRVNGKPVDAAILNSGDTIQVGSAEFVFEDQDEDERLRAAGRQGVCYLEWITGGTKGERVMLDQARVSLGRRDSNTIQLTDRMSSGHHCEITKDLNGYTIRDLGSTNGSLVNGEPVSEIPLSHGARLRVGNSRFVFKDPSMKDIEVELSQFDEDEGWGMMGDIDLTKARGSNAGLLIGLVILVAAGVGAWYISQQAALETGDESSLDLANLIENGAMDDDGFIVWALDTENVDVDVRIRSGGRPGNTLQVRHEGQSGAPVTVWYQDEWDALADEPFRVKAWFKGEAETPTSLVAMWSTDSHAVSHTLVLATGSGWTEVDRVLVKPEWAGGLRLGVLVAPGATGRVDGVRVERVSEGALSSLDCPGSPQAYVTPSGALDLLDSVGRPLALGLGPVAEIGGRIHRNFVAESVSGSGGNVTVAGHFEGGDEAVAARVAWSTSAEGLTAEVECTGASRVGLRAALVRSRVGDIVNVLTPAGARALAANGGQTVKDVQKTLAGNPDGAGAGRRSLVTFVSKAPATLTLTDGADDALLGFTHWSAGGSASMGIVTDHSLQREQAQAALASGRGQLREQPGLGIETLRKVAVEFPFEKAIAGEALAAAGRRETRAQQDIEKLSQLLASFKIYRSAGALAEVETLRNRLAAEFPARENGHLEGLTTRLVAAVDEARRTYYQEVRGPELARLESLAELLGEVEGYGAMAALYLRAIVTRFAGMENDDSPMGRRVAKAKASLAQLLAKNEDLAKAVPPKPDSQD